ENVVGVDVVERGQPAMRRLRHQPDMEAVIAPFAAAMGRERKLPVRGKPAANDDIFVFAVLVFAGDARRRNRKAGGGGKRDRKGEAHPAWSARERPKFIPQA